MTMRSVRDPGGTVRHVPTFSPAKPAPRGKKARHVPDPIKTKGDEAAEELRQIVERAERVQEEVKAAQDDLADVFAEAKGRGYDPKAVRRIMAIRRKKREAGTMTMSCWRRSRARFTTSAPAAIRSWSALASWIAAWRSTACASRGRSRIAGRRSPRFGPSRHGYTAPMMAVPGPMNAAPRSPLPPVTPAQRLMPSLTVSRRSASRMPSIR
jgi:uncharacterized protein (UPF0335 family)